MIDIKDVSLNLNKRQILDHVSLKLQEGKSMVWWETMEVERQC